MGAREDFEPEPDEALAALMNRDLGTQLEAREVRMFVRANWRKISLLAHQIHGTAGQRQCSNLDSCRPGEPNQ